MGKPKFSRKKYETPSHPWKAERIKAEGELVRKYGLKNKREVWRAETRLRKYRGEARRLLAHTGSEDSQGKKEISQLLMSLTRLNILPPNSNLDDVLALDNEKILSRRLQTQAYLKGLARTPKQARQLIIHGHIAVDGKRVTVPSYMLEKKEEDQISYANNSPLNVPMHPERPQPKFQPGIKTTPARVETTNDNKVKKEEQKSVEKAPEKEVKEEEKVEKTENKEESKPVRTEDKTKEEKPITDKVESKPEETKEEDKPEDNKQKEETEVKVEEKKDEPDDKKGGGK